MNYDIKVIELTPGNISEYGVCGYKDVKKHKELRNKIQWYSEYYPKGLRIKIIVSETGGYQGMIEYIPGEYAHRPVNASGYMFIHCLFTGFKKEYKNLGFGTLLLNECLKDTEEAGMNGVAAVTRKGSFMAGKNIFMKNGFISVENCKPDFELVVKKFNEKTENPSFADMDVKLKKYIKGLYILRSVQCPYTEKNVNAMIESAEKDFGVKANIIDLKGHREAQQSPCPFGVFCVIYNGKIISHHPISNTRFINIMKSLI